MSELQLSEFKEWFTKKYTYGAEYFALAHFDVGRGFFTTNDMYNPDATNAAWVLRASFGAWNHQQAIIDNLKTQLNNMETCYIEKKKEVEELQERIDVSKSSQPKLHKTDIGDCLHFSTTMFHDGKATCFDCDAVVNHKREVIGVMQTKALRGAND